ncbi:oligoendopeptidase F [Paucibacter sp. APW11]|uniref:Oligopeptidase F n=1 Tax=Roseateles aquae TaxID=3077235 RepID=A0ABU3PH62_9BURK|nr:oligoendopeptidase F [Paucibacter sp. APW11]MDT9001886.1 oligoendopeptidase F [Paucibacter sp. APW11]
MKLHSIALAAALCLAALPPSTAQAADAATAAKPGAAASAQVWDLSQLYASDAAWESERQALAAELPRLRALEGTLGSSAKALLAGMDQMSALRRRLSRWAIYASLKADENTQITENQARRQLASTLGNQYGEATSFVNAEIAAIGRAKVEAFIAAEPSLAKHRQSLTTMLRMAEHTLSPKEEALLAGAAEALEQPQQIYTLLTNADLPWPKLEIRGKTVVLDQEQYAAHRSDPDPAVRKQVFDAFWPVYKAYERTIGAVYAANLRGTVFNARARKFSSSVAMAQADYNIPEAVYRTLVQEANAGLPTLHRYLKLRSKVLGLPQAGYQDMYVPLAKPAGTSYTQAEAEALTLAALKPLGEPYVKQLGDAFKQRWMHSLPQRGKRSGAYMNGSAYDVHPYLLMSFNGDYNSVSTFAHEWGHAMHTVFSNSQPYENSGYSTFIAEIPSTANELLLSDYMVEHAKSREEKLFALSQQLENLRTTFFRQAMFAEFELASHEAAEKGQPITGEGLSKLYLDLLKRYHGHEQGVVKIDDLFGIEWAYIPHFYRDFYVYQYATCVSAAAFFAEGLAKGDTALRERYFAMLKAGNSADPYPLTVAAGLDLASPAPYRALVRRMNRVMDQLEALLAEKR